MTDSSPHKSDSAPHREISTGGPDDSWIGHIRPWHFFLLAILFSGLCASLQFPARDALERYAPATDAFVRGNWTYAFHPRFGLFFTTISGSIAWLTGLSGANACKLTGVLFFALSVFPLHRLFLRLWDKETAFWGTLCTISCAHLARYAGQGIRDSGKTLALALIALALVSFYHHDSRWRHVIELAIGGAILTLIRAEGGLIAVLCGLTGVWLLRDWRKSLAGVLLYLALLTPQNYYHYHAIGYFVPELRYGLYLQKLGIPPADHALMTIP